MESGDSKEFVIRRRVQFVETDLAGVLHFSNYFRWMEEVECAYWRSLEIGVIVNEGEEQISWPRVAVSCEYFAPAHFEEELEVALRVVNVGERSVTYEIEFRLDGQRTALGKTTAVCCAQTPGSFRPRSIPKRLRDLLLHTASST